MEALEGHLANLEGRKPGSGGTTPTSGGHRYEDIVKFTCYTIYDVLLNFAVFIFHFICRVNVAAAVNVLNTTSKYLDGIRPFININ